MLINKDYLVEKVTSKDPSRSILHIMELVEEEKQGYLIATNGRALAKVPVKLDEGDTLGKVSAEALVSARKAAPGRSSEATLQVNGAQVIPDGHTFPRPTIESHGIYPEWRNVWPKEPATFAVTLDANELHALAQALGNKIVTLEFVDSTTAIRVRGRYDANGLLMPCRA